MFVNNCYGLKFSALKKLHQILILEYFYHLYLLQLYFALPNNFIVSGDNNSHLKPVFLLKTILFLILFP